MLKQQKCILTLFFSVILQTLVRHGSCQTIAPTTTEEESEELTEGILDLESLLDLDGQYGRYSTQDYSYVNWQHYYEDEMYFANQNYHHIALIHQRCSADFVKCLSNLEIPHIVCAYFWLGNYPAHRYKYFQSYCHVYLENCFLYHRRYRMVNYGSCFFAQDVPDERWEYPWEDNDMNTNSPVLRT